MKKHILLFALLAFMGSYAFAQIQTDTIDSDPSGGGSGGGGVSFGLANEIPFTNATADDFGYNSGFFYDGTNVVVPRLGVNGTSSYMEYVANELRLNAGSAYRYRIANNTEYLFNATGAQFEGNNLTNVGNIEFGPATSKNAGNNIWTIDSSDLDSDTDKFFFTQGCFTNSTNPRDNCTYNLGYNFLNGGGRNDATDIGIALRWETFFEAGPFNKYEFHIEGVSTLGTNNRFLSFEADRDEAANSYSAAMFVDQLSLITANRSGGGGTAIFQFLNAAEQFQLHQNSLIVKLTNNSKWLFQDRALGAGSASMMYIDSADILRIGDEPNTAGIAFDDEITSPVFIDVSNGLIVGADTDPSSATLVDFICDGFTCFQGLWTYDNNATSSSNFFAVRLGGTQGTPSNPPSGANLGLLQSWMGNGTDLAFGGAFGHRLVGGVNSNITDADTLGFIQTSDNGTVADRWLWQPSGHYEPAADTTYDIGTTTNSVRQIYTENIQLDTLSDKGTCTSTNAGELAYELVSDVGTLYVCRQSAASTFAWTALH